MSLRRRRIIRGLQLEVQELKDKLQMFEEGRATVIAARLAEWEDERTRWKAHLHEVADVIQVALTYKKKRDIREVLEELAHKLLGEHRYGPDPLD